jgi:RNA polymerase sigma-70 factor (ECF subfamily)
MAVNYVRLATTETACPAAERDLDCLDAYTREFDYLCQTLRRLSVAESEIEDLAQEVFLVLHRNWAGYDASRPIRPYLFGIAFRITSNQRRRIRELPSASVDLEDSSPRPDQVLQAKQTRAVVLRALDRVPLVRRAILLMHDLDEVPMHDIASELSIPLFTAYSRLRKARKEFERAVRRLRKEVSAQ